MPLLVGLVDFYTINILGALPEPVLLHPIRSEVAFILHFLVQYCLGYLKKPNRQMIYKFQKSHNRIFKEACTKIYNTHTFFAGTFNA